MKILIIFPVFFLLIFFPMEDTNLSWIFLFQPSIVGENVWKRKKIVNVSHVYGYFSFRVNTQLIYSFFKLNFFTAMIINVLGKYSSRNQRTAIDLQLSWSILHITNNFAGDFFIFKRKIRLVCSRYWLWSLIMVFCACEVVRSLWKSRKSSRW